MEVGFCHGTRSTEFDRQLYLGRCRPSPQGRGRRRGQYRRRIPLTEEGGIEASIEHEVLPHAPDAWYVESSVKTGYEISFSGYFYKPEPMRGVDEIRADILAMERETEGLLRLGQRAIGSQLHFQE